MSPCDPAASLLGVRAPEGLTDGHLRLKTGCVWAEVADLPQPARPLGVSGALCSPQLEARPENAPCLFFFRENQTLSWPVCARKPVRLLAPCAAAFVPRVPRVLVTWLPVAEQVCAPFWPRVRGVAPGVTTRNA